ncbi:unnamed protein product [Urochloa humidicola]
MAFFIEPLPQTPPPTHTHLLNPTSLPLSLPPPPSLPAAAPPTAPPPLPCPLRRDLDPAWERGSEWEKRHRQPVLAISLALAAPLRVTQLPIAPTIFAADPGLDYLDARPWRPDQPWVSAPMPR